MATDKPPRFTSREYRDALGCFATGVTVITGVSPDGEIIGLTASSFSSVSLDPPLVLFSIHLESLSLKTFLASQHFAVNVLREGQESLSQQFATHKGERWKNVDFITWESGCPILIDALASFECKIRHSYHGGDHVILVGEVMRIWAAEEGDPLLYLRGRYRRVASGS